MSASTLFKWTKLYVFTLILFAVFTSMLQWVIGLFFVPLAIDNGALHAELTTAVGAFLGGAAGGIFATLNGYTQFGRKLEWKPVAAIGASFAAIISLNSIVAGLSCLLGVLVYLKSLHQRQPADLDVNYVPPEGAERKE